MHSTATSYNGSDLVARLILQTLQSWSSTLSSGERRETRGPEIDWNRGGSEVRYAAAYGRVRDPDRILLFVWPWYLERKQATAGLRVR